MIGGIAVLLGFQLIGELIVRGLSLPVPGPVIGMLLLLAALVIRGAVPPSLSSTARGLLQHLSLLFVPAGVGVLAHLGLIRGQFWAIVLAVVAGTVVAMSVTALTMRFVLRLATHRAGGHA